MSLDTVDTSAAPAPAEAAGDYDYDPALRFGDTSAETPEETKPDDETPGDEEAPSTDDLPEDEPEAEAADEDAGDDEAVDPQFLTFAREFGYSADDVSALGADNVERIIRNFVGRHGDPRKPREQQERKADPPQQQAREQKHADYVPKLTEDDYSPEVLEEFRNLNAHWQQRFSQLEERLAAREQTAEQIEQQRANTLLAETFDQWAQSEDYRDIFGEGPMDALDGNGRHADARVKVFVEAAAIREFRAMRGLKPQKQEEVFAQALDTVFGDRRKQTARKQVERAVAKRGDQQIARPSYRGSQKPLGDEAAVDFVENYFKSIGR